MKTAASFKSVDEEREIREAARMAARRDGVSLGDWLDDVMTKRADALGLDVASLPPDQRVHAVMQGLGWSAPTDEAAEPDEARPQQAVASSATPAKQEGVPIVERLGNAYGDTGPLDPEGLEPALPPKDDAGPAVAQAARRQAAQRTEIETKLNALFKALSRPARRAPQSGPGSADPDGVPADGERVQSLLSETAISPSWRLEKAVAEIAERQAYLDRQAAGDANLATRRTPASRFGSPRAAAADLRRHFDSPADEGSALSVEQDAAWRLAEATASHDRQRPSAATPARAPADPVPSIFTSLQGDIAKLAKRLETVHFNVSRQQPAPSASGTSFDEIRALLDEMRPDASIDTLGRHVEALSAKLDKAIDHRVPAEAVNRLSQRIEEVHAEVASRLSAQATAAPDPSIDLLGRHVVALSQKLDQMIDYRVPAETVERLSQRIEAVQAEVADRLSTPAATPTIDMAAIEQMIRDVLVRVERPGQRMPDLRGLEEAVHDLVGKLEKAERSQSDGPLLLELQAQVGRLAERIDRSDAGLTAIVAMERSLGEMFAQIGDIRDASVDAATTAARAVAQDTMRVRAAETSAATRQVSNSDAAVKMVSEELAEMRTARGEADKRLHAILGALNTSLERVVDRLGALESDVADSHHQADPPVAARMPAEPVVVATPVRASLDRDREDMLALDRALGSMTPVDLDRPVEPIVSAARARVEGRPLETSAAAPDPTSFIAAARRAAQTAAQEQSGRAEASAFPRARVVAKAMGPSTLTKVKGALAANRRPLLLALASIVLLMGVAQIVRLSLKSGETVSTSDNTAISAPRIDTADGTADTPVKTADIAATSKDGPPVSATDVGPAAAPALPDATAVVPSTTLPTLAMGPAASIAAARVAENAAKAGPLSGLPAGLREMAMDGHADAQYEVGLRYADARGVPRDLKAAAGWFEKAAKQGLAPAAYRLGSLYERGMGVPRDPVVSTSWYQKAADAGNVRAAHNLAVMSAEGATGKADYPTAAALFTKAAEAGVKDSQFNLAILYARGLGVDQNLGKSYMWFAIAAGQGDSDSAKKRDEVAQKLDPTALAAAKAAIDTFKPTATNAAANDVSPPAGGWDAVAAAHPITSFSAPVNAMPSRVSVM